MTKLKSKNLRGIRLTGLQEQVLNYLVSRAEEEHSFLIDVNRSDIVSELKIKGTGTISKIFSRLEDLGLVKSMGGNSYKISTTFYEFVESKDTAFTHNKTDVSADFLPVASWLQDTAFTEENYCVAYRVLKDKSVFNEKDKLASKEFLADKVNKYGVAFVVDKINRGFNNTDSVELEYILS